MIGSHGSLVGLETGKKFYFSAVYVCLIASRNLKRPRLVFGIYSFLGLARYYRRFIQDISQLAAPMTRLTQKELRFEWNDLCEKAFQELKMRLMLAPILIVLDKGTRGQGDKGTQCTMMPPKTDWDMF